MGLTVAQVQTRLARFEFEALFVNDLGWLAGPPTEGDWPGDKVQRSWVMAHSPTAGKPALVVETEGPEWRDRPLPEVFEQLRSLAQRLENGLVIWRDGANQSPGQRSLWCWANGESDHSDRGSQVVVHGEVSQGWATRLLSLHRDRLLARATLYPLPAEVTPDPALAEGFNRSWQALIAALPSLPGTSRLPYATLLLSRLIAIAALQQRGYLGHDEWYLQNQFGQSQQRGIDSFFAQVLQPLWQQGFTLPDEERAPGIRKRFGPLPFLPTGPFRFTELDQKWGHVPLPDAAFEPTLNWLADLLTANPDGLDRGLGELLEQAVNEHDGAAIATPAPLLDALCDRTIHATVLDRAEALTGQRHQSIEHLLLEISPTSAGALLQIIGRLTLLDPACGSGRFLVAALDRLMDLTQGLRAIARLDSAKNVPNWAQPSPYSPALGLYQHLTGRALYGLDLWPPAVELARLQLWLQGVRHTTRPAELTTLPDLTLSLFQGNALMGLMRVDDERFDQVQPKRGARGKPNAEAAPLQGNLLQPLMADSYEAILAERQVRLEHYRSQTELLAEVGSVPAYAQADFLRDRLEELNQIAQAKLTYLLWGEGSQQLGLRVPDPAVSRPTRPLSQGDVEATQPFHWGFYFHRLLRDQGGFDMVLSHFPRG
ncbi:MAG: DNA methyltransferase, partial [Cyanobacteria bacterium J06638_6]